MSRNGRIVTFYSYRGGVGRTTALANVAWILASNGHRVLAVDWDLESPSLHRSFHPFLDDKALRSTRGVLEVLRDHVTLTNQPGPAALDPNEKPIVERYTVDLQYTFPGDGCLHFIPAGQQTSGYSEMVSTFDWDAFYDRMDGGRFVEALALDMRDNYDFTLIDSRTGLSDTAGICTVAIPDTVVNCFTPSSQSVEAALAVSRSIQQQASNQVTVLPVIMRMSDDDAPHAEQRRIHAHRSFASFHQGRDTADYWSRAEIPYRSRYAYEETLAIFAEKAGHGHGLLDAFGRLAELLAGRSCRLPEIPEPTRLHWLAQFEEPAAAASTTAVVSYHSRDQMWAEWIAAELRASGRQCALHHAVSADPVPDADHLIVLLSASYARSVGAAPMWSEVAVVVRLDDTATPEPNAGRLQIELGTSATAARKALFGAIGQLEGLTPPALTDPQQSIRFPAVLPPIWRVPARNQEFTGRDNLMLQLRERVRQSPPARPTTLTGLGGVGKTQLALEYAHRYAAGYDLVWWISAEQPALVRTALALLADELGLEAGDDPNAKASAVLEALAEDSAVPRWLIVFDNAEVDGELHDFIPRGAGHVIVTARGRQRSHPVSAMEIGVFDRTESVDLLRRRAAWLGEEDAAAIAARLGDFPLALEQAAAFLSATGQDSKAYLRLLDEKLHDVLDRRAPADHPRSVAKTWDLTLERLRQGNPAAAALLEVCAFFGPEPIPTSLLFGSRMISLLVDYDPALRDPMLHGSLVRHVAQFGLAQVDPATGAVRVHRLVQSVVRDGLSDEARSEHQMRVTNMMAEAVPVGGPEDRQNWVTYEAIRPHLAPSGALESADAGVRHLTLDMVRYLRLRGDLAGSKELAEDVLAHWREQFGPDDALTLRMAVQLAATLRARGMYRGSGQLSQDTVPRFSRTLGHGHPYTLEAMDGLADDLLGLGEYRHARDLVHNSYLRWYDALGEDHALTMTAAHRLAASHRLMGSFREAERLDLETLERRRRLLGEYHPATLASADSHARDLRELGRLGPSRVQVEQTLATCRDVLGNDHPDSLRTAKNLAVALRALGDGPAAVELLRDTASRYQRILGVRHPHTIACDLETAYALSAFGEHDQARVMAEKVTTEVPAIFGSNHPCCLVATHNLGVLHLRAASHADAQPLLEPAYESFSKVLGPEHPHTLVALANWALLCDALGRRDEARRLGTDAWLALQEQLAAEHPTVLAVACFLDADTARPAVVRQLGEHHPYAVAAAAGRPICLDIELQPI